MLLHENLLLEVRCVAHFHEFVGVARIAIFAGKFAAAIRIDCPLERYALTVAPAQYRAHRQSEVFHLMALADGFSAGRKAGDTHEFGSRFGEERVGKHFIRFFFAYHRWPVADCQGS